MKTTQKRFNNSLIIPHGSLYWPSISIVNKYLHKKEAEIFDLILNAKGILSYFIVYVNENRLQIFTE